MSLWSSLQECLLMYTKTKTFTLNIGTPYLITRLVLNLQQVHLPPLDVSGNCWMSGRQYSPDQMSGSVSSVWVYTVCSCFSIPVQWVNTVFYQVRLCQKAYLQLISVDIWISLLPRVVHFHFAISLSLALLNKLRCHIHF